IRERAVQLVVEALPGLQLGDVALALGALTLAPLRFADVVLRPGQRPARFDHGELGLAQRAHRTVVAILGLAISLVGEALGAHREAERSEEHTSELQSRGHLVCRLLLEKKNN